MLQQSVFPSTKVRLNRSKEKPLTPAPWLPPISLKSTISGAGGVAQV